MIIQSTKVYDGFSTVFRQWRATDTHCSRIHGYAVKFKVTFEGEMDERNWVVDFGRAKRSPVLVNNLKLDAWLKELLDHTMLIAEDDPELRAFQELEKRGAVKLHILEHVGAERFALFLFDVLNTWCFLDTEGRVKVRQIELFEHDKNSAIVTGQDQDYEKYISKTPSAYDFLTTHLDAGELRDALREEATWAYTLPIPPPPLTSVEPMLDPQTPTETDEDFVFASLYEYLGYPAGGDVGKAVAAEASKRGIPKNFQSVSLRTGYSKVAIYPVSFLNDFFKGGRSEN